MTSYSTIDYLPDLKKSEMDFARTLIFEKYEPVSGIDTSLLGWDNAARFSTSEDYAILNDEFVFEGKEGATYDIFSSSFFDPFILLLYDNQGNVIAIDEDEGSYGSDMIFNFVAPYTGKYYINASWNQGSADGHKFVSASVYEDVDTIPPPTPIPTPAPEPTPTPTPTPTPDIDYRDRIFNYGEGLYSDLFPGHSESLNVFGYYARMYPNGNGLGEKGDNIYFYDGGSDGTGNITLVGSVPDLLIQVTSAGF